MGSPPFVCGSLPSMFLIYLKTTEGSSYPSVRLDIRAKSKETQAQRADTGSLLTDQNGVIMNYPGILIPSRRVFDAKSKTEAENALFDWQSTELPAEGWIAKLDEGNIIQPSAFDAKDDGTITHAIKYWKHTYFICADADNIKGVEFDDEGKDNNPNGIEPWTEHGQLSVKFPGLLEKAYAVGESVSSMLKEPLHRRFRIIFLFDQPISNEDHYRHIQQILAEEFPIISQVSRSPAQPVFGNGREGFDFHICGNILNLEDYPMPAEPPKKEIDKQQTFDSDEKLDEFLRRHNIGYTEGKDPGKYYLECPYRSGHTGQKQGKTDSYVFDDGNGWAFYCSHAHCADKRTWQAFKDGMGIKNGNGYHKPNSNGHYQIEEPINLSPLPTNTDNPTPQFPDYEGELFLGAFGDLYEAYAESHVWSPEMLMAMGIGAMSFAANDARVATHEKSKAWKLNSYILAVGESDLTAKSEAISEVKKFMHHIDDSFAPLSNVQSIEGLLKALNECEERPERYCLFDEGSVVFENTRRSGTKNLFSGLNEIWLCPASYATGRAAGTDQVDHPYVCCWGNIPTKLISAVFRHEDMIGGSLNRWLPFYIQPKIETQRYPHAKPEPYDKWINALHSARMTLEPRRLTFTPQADDTRFEWFKQLRADAIASGEQIGESRFHTHAVKLSGIFALAENSSTDHEVHEHQWDAALKVVRYLTACGEYLFRNVGATRIGELENEILDILNQNGNEMSLSDLQKKTRRFDREEREKIIVLLETHKQILRFTEKTKGRSRVIIRRIT